MMADYWGQAQKEERELERDHVLGDLIIHYKIYVIWSASKLGVFFLSNIKYKWSKLGAKPL